MISVNEKIWYAEVYYVLKYLGIEYIRKVPQNLIDIIETSRDKDYKFDFDISKPLNEQNLRQETKDIIAALNLIYWEEDEQKKQKLMQKYKENDIIYERELEEKYSYENLFKNRTKSQQVVEETKEVMVIEKQGNIIKRIINKIKNIFRRKNR